MPPCDIEGQVMLLGGMQALVLGFTANGGGRAAVGGAGGCCRQVVLGTKQSCLRLLAQPCHLMGPQQVQMCWMTPLRAEGRAIGRQPGAACCASSAPVTASS